MAFIVGSAPSARKPQPPRSALIAVQDGRSRPPSENRYPEAGGHPQRLPERPEAAKSMDAANRQVDHRAQRQQDNGGQSLGQRTLVLTWADRGYDAGRCGLRERHSSRLDHPDEPRQQVMSPAVDRQVDRQLMVSDPGRGGRPRAAHAYRMQPSQEEADQQLHPLQRP
jgi:hypothetical protein